MSFCSARNNEKTVSLHFNPPKYATQTYDVFVLAVPNLGHLLVEEFLEQVLLANVILRGGALLAGGLHLRLGRQHCLTHRGLMLLLLLVVVVPALENDRRLTRVIRITVSGHGRCRGGRGHIAITHIVTKLWFASVMLL